MQLERAKQTSESIELGILLALVGGFMDAYSYIGRDHVFSNAQTGNILLTAVHLSQGDFPVAARYLLSVLAFAAGIMLSDFIHARFVSRLHWRQAALLFEVVVMAVVAFIPAAYNVGANCLLSLACGTQVETFRKIHGKGMATTMCIGNLRNALHNVDDYIINHDRGFLYNGGLYFGAIGCFMVGAVLGNWCIDVLGLHAILVCTPLLAAAFLIMFIDREH